MNIKKIIRETVDDFDWIRDIPTIPKFWESDNWIIVNDTVEEDPYMKKEQQLLFDNDIPWLDSGKNIWTPDSSEEVAYFMALKSNADLFGSGPDVSFIYLDEFNDIDESKYEHVIYTSQIK